MKEFRSWRSYFHFVDAVVHQARYVGVPEVNDFLQVFLETSESRRRLIKKDHVLWRAQLGEGEPETVERKDGVEMRTAYPRERMKPQPGLATIGRANRKGIPCVYLSDHRETAMTEGRPWVGSAVSVSQFKVTRDLQGRRLRHATGPDGTHHLHIGGRFL